MKSKLNSNMNKFYVKVHSTEGKSVLAICDEEILGKTFSADGLKLNINERFYKGKLKNQDEIVKILPAFGDINLVGKNIIALAIEMSFVDEQSVLKVDDMPYAMVFNL